MVRAVYWSSGHVWTLAADELVDVVDWLPSGGAEVALDLRAARLDDIVPKDDNASRKVPRVARVLVDAAVAEVDEGRKWAGRDGERGGVVLDETKLASIREDAALDRGGDHLDRIGDRGTRVVREPAGDDHGELAWVLVRRGGLHWPQRGAHLLRR
jgi:hypothetical protein